MKVLATSKVKQAEKSYRYFSTSKIRVSQGLTRSTDNVSIALGERVAHSFDRYLYIFWT
jgi:hypothetical protein